MAMAMAGMPASSSTRGGVIFPLPGMMLLMGFEAFHAPLDLLALRSAPVHRLQPRWLRPGWLRHPDRNGQPGTQVACEIHGLGHQRVQLCFPIAHGCSPPSQSSGLTQPLSSGPVDN
jgi:hypothetical protein